MQEDIHTTLIEFLEARARAAESIVESLQQQLNREHKTIAALREENRRLIELNGQLQRQQHIESPDLSECRTRLRDCLYLTEQQVFRLKQFEDTVSREARRLAARERLDEKRSRNRQGV